MEMFKRKIKLFFVSYGKLLLFVIGVIFMAVLTIQTLNSIVIETNNSKYSERIEKLVNESVYNIGHSDEVGANYIIEAIQRKINERKKEN